MDDSSNSNYSSNYTLPSKRFEICRQLLRSFTLRLCETGLCIRRFESRLTTYKMLTLNSSKPTFFVADMEIPFGRYGLFVWPMWSWPIWSVADMVQTPNSVPTVYQSLITVKNSQKTVKTTKMTIRVPIVTCLTRLCQQCTNRSSHVYQDYTNSVPIVKNSEKQSKDGQNSKNEGLRLRG